MNIEYCIIVMLLWLNPPYSKIVVLSYHKTFRSSISLYIAITLNTECSTDDLPTPTKPARSTSKASTSSQSSPTRASPADTVVNGTRSPPSRGSVESSPAPPPRKRPRRGIMSVDLPPATSNVDEVTPMEVTGKDKIATDDSMLLCVDVFCDLIILIV